MTEIQIHRATPADAAAISRLHNEILAVHAAALPWLFKVPGPETLPPAEVIDLLAKEATLMLVATAGSTGAEEAGAGPCVLGYLYAEIIRRPETSTTYARDVIYIHHIGVDAGCRRGGAGTKLISAVHAAATELGIAMVTVDVWSFNTPARAFFDRNGLMPYNEKRWNR